MAIQSPAEVAKAVGMIDTQSQKLMDEGKKNLTAYKKKAAEFETIRGGLLEGASVIVEHQKELAAMYVTFDKMTTKLDGLRKDMETQGKALRGVQKLVVEAVPDVRELGKDADKLLPLNKGNALLKEAKTTCDTLDKSLGQMKESLEVAAADCEGLPGEVPRPK